MHFCDKCDNMYYIRISSEDENVLIYYCRNCGHEDTELTKNNICVSKTQLKKSEQKYNHIDVQTDKLQILFDTNDNIIGFLDTGTSQNENK